MQIGIFGGTFDPVHVGHLILAEQCRDQANLDQVWFVPAFRPPHKPDEAVTPFHHRVEMLTLAVAGHPAFRIDELEKDRPGTSYTVDTLEELHRRHPDHQFHLIIGSDILPDLGKWRRPERIAELAGFLVLERPGWPHWTVERLREALSLPADFDLRLRRIEGPLIHIASRDLRRWAAEGRTIRYLVPRAVEVYVGQHRLYRP
jgi:nicotinate-nucleotide adenylyltransferase